MPSSARTSTSACSSTRNSSSVVTLRGRLESVEHAEPGQGVRVDAVGRINESWMLLTIDRETDEQTLADLGRRSVASSPTCASRSRTGQMRTRCLVIAAELEGTPRSGWTPTGPPRATTFPALDGRQPLHLPRLPRLRPLKDLGEGRRSSGDRHRAGAHCAATRRWARARCPHPMGA